MDDRVFGHRCISLPDFVTGLFARRYSGLLGLGKGSKAAASRQKTGDRLQNAATIIFTVWGPTIRSYIIVESASTVVSVDARDHDGEPFRAEGLADGDILELAEIAIEMPVASIYEGMLFDQDSSPA